MPARLERRLGQIESELELAVPRLATMFAMFTRLTAGERPNGAERLLAPGRLSSPRWRGPGQWPGLQHFPGLRDWHPVFRRPEIVALVMVAIAIASVVAFASSARPQDMRCPRQAASAQSQAPPPVMYGAPLGSRCPMYITSK